MTTTPTVPFSNDVSRPFWEGVERCQLMLQYDPAAGKWQFYPRAISLWTVTPVEWRPASGLGILLAFSESRVRPPGFERAEYLIHGLVALEEGPRIFSQLEGPPEGFHVGQAVELSWAEPHAGQAPYRFKPRN